jgi:hypothetical protein
MSSPILALASRTGNKEQKTIGSSARLLLGLMQIMHGLATSGRLTQATFEVHGKIH